jgi:hypothetical protein
MKEAGLNHTQIVDGDKVLAGGQAEPAAARSRQHEAPQRPSPHRKEEPPTSSEKPKATHGEGQPPSQNPDVSPKSTNIKESVDGSGNRITSWKNADGDQIGEIRGQDGGLKSKATVREDGTYEVRNKGSDGSEDLDRGSPTQSMHLHKSPDGSSSRRFESNDTIQTDEYGPKGDRSSITIDKKTGMGEREYTGPDGQTLKAKVIDI